MWRIASLVMCALIASVLAGCDPTVEYKYYAVGIGTDLTTQEVSSAADLQDAYLNELCRQAGVAQSVSVTSGSVLGCYPYGNGPLWGLVTLAGLNEIDQRCDAYLAWLDDKRRSREPILAELSAISAATQAILNATGVGAGPITLVGIAFGLASSTFTNIRARLLFEVDHSTVVSVVLNRQRDFRSTLRPQLIVTRADAVYFMRSYLRICMPMTIEMNINTTVTIVEQVGADALFNKPPVTFPAGVLPLTAKQSPPVTKSQPVPSCKGAQECAMTKQDVMHLQTLLCLPEDGVFGSETRVGISIYQDTRRLPLTGEIGQTESRKWVQDFAQMGACTLAAQNFYERLNFATADKVDGLKTKLLQIVPDPPLSLNGKFDQPTRDKITAVRNALMPPNEKIDPVPNGQMTRVLNVAIDNQLRH